MFRYVLTIALLVSMQPGLTAEEIRFGEGTNEFDFSFSQSAAHLDGTLRLISPYPLSDDFDDVVTVRYRSGELKRMALESEEGLHAYTHYEYGPGRLIIQLVHTPDVLGPPVIRTFQARAEALVFTVTERDCFETPDCRSSNWYPRTEFSITLGRGRFDPALAALLGVPRRTSGGSFDLVREEIVGGLDETRIGYANGTRLLIAPSVPAPTVGGLSLVAVPVLALWRRRCARGGVAQHTSRRMPRSGTTGMR